MAKTAVRVEYPKLSQKVATTPTNARTRPTTFRVVIGSAGNSQCAPTATKRGAV